MPAIYPQLMHDLRRLVSPAALETAGDAELLERFRRGRDEEAFAVLVRRHGPMVLRVCRRVLGDRHAAEDAFQATFLVLARRAGWIRRPTALAAWLFGTAQRVALKARARRACTVLPEDVPAAADDVLATLTVRELLARLDEEVQRLPERYRLPVILCCLEGKTQDEAARQLGWTAGSVKGRLERGRKRLHDRLVRRGIVPAATLAALEVARADAGSVLPSTLVHIAVRAAAEPGAAVGISAEALALAQAMTAPPLKCLLLLLLLTGGVLALASVGTPRIEEAPPPAAPKESPRAAPRQDRQGDPLPAEAVARIGSNRLRTQGRLRWSDYAPDGKSILSAAQPDKLQLWDAATGALQRTITTDVAWPSALAWSGDACVFFSSGTVRTIDLQSGQERRRLDLPDAKDAFRAQLSRGGEMLAVAELQGVVRLFDVRTGKEKHRLPCRANFPTGLAFTPDGKMLAVSGNTSAIQLFDTATGALRFELDTPLQEVGHINIAPDGRTLLAGSQSRRPIVLYDLVGRKEQARLEGDPEELGVICSAFSPDSKQLAVGSQWKYVSLHETATGKELRRLRTWPSCSSLAFSPDGNTLLVGIGGGALSQWDAASGRLRVASAHPYPGFNVLRFVDRDQHLLGIDEGHVVIDWKTGRTVRRFAESESYFPVWSGLAPDETLLVSTSEDGKTGVLLDAASGKLVRKLAGPGRITRYTRFSHDGKQLFTSSNDGVVRLWDTATGQLRHELKNHSSLLVERMVPSPDGHWLATASTDASARGDYDVRLWDLATGQLARRITPRRGSAFGMTFTPDSSALVVVGGQPGRASPQGEVSLFDVRTGREIHAFVGHKEGVSCVAVSPDGQTLATGGVDGSLLLWEIASARLRHRLVGHQSGVHGLAFSSDGALLAASSAEAPTYVWDIYDKQQAPAALAAAEQRRLWDQLASADPAEAFAAMRRLIGSGPPALALLRQHLRPAPAPDEQHLRELLQGLESESFTIRRRAYDELAKQGDRIEGLLRRANEQSRPLETRRRLEDLLKGLDTPGPERLRELRALEVLEQLGGPEAHRLLASLAAGPPAARWTRAAQAARDRLERRMAAADLGGP